MDRVLVFCLSAVRGWIGVFFFCYLRRALGFACLTLTGGDGATAGAETSHRAGHGSISRNAKGQFLKLRKGGEVGAPVSATSVLYPPVDQETSPRF
jgi:hypothetical protein